MTEEKNNETQHDGLSSGAHSNAPEERLIKDSASATGQADGPIKPEVALDDNPSSRGGNKKGKARTLFVAVQEHLLSRYEFRRNEVTQQTECRLKNHGQEFTQVNSDAIFRELKVIGFSIKLEELRSLLRSDFATPYDPFKEYFESLPAWDQTTDHIAELANFLKTDDDQFFTTQFKKALVRSIACALDTYPNRIVIVFVGVQEKGKSWFLKFLNPWGEFKYYTEAPLRDDKDTMMRCSENFLYNMEEMASLSNYEITKLKALISMSVVKERKPYAVDEIARPRRCTFWGSTNKDEFLADETGNTRFLCFKLKSIDFSYRQKIDKHLVWAQAYALFKQGYEYELTQEERQKRDEINQRYEVTYVEREVIERCLRPGKKNDGESVFRTATEILEYLYERTRVHMVLGDSGTWGRINLKQFNVIKALGALGYEKDRQRIAGIQKRGYWIIKIDDAEALNMEELAKHELRKMIDQDEKQQKEKRKEIKREKDISEYHPEDGLLDFPLPEIPPINPEDSES